MEKHAVSRLIGAPPGYIGHEQGGQLTEAVRRRPYSVVLFDEIEKAHGDVLNVLLQVLDDGRLTDSLGKTVSFENTVRRREEKRRRAVKVFFFLVEGGSRSEGEEKTHFFLQKKLNNNKKKQMIVLTSNIGATILLDQRLPPKAKKDAVLSACRSHFRPELLNRLDEIIVFDALTPEMLRDVARIQARGLEARLLARGVGLEFTGEALAWAASRSFDPSYGVSFVVLFFFFFFFFFSSGAKKGEKEKNSHFSYFKNSKNKTKQARPLRRWLEKNVITALSKKIIAGEVEEGDLVVVGVSPDAAARAERKQKSKAASAAVTSDDEEAWVSVEEDEDSGLVYDVKKGKGPPVAGADASSNGPSASSAAAAGIKRSKMETAPSEALTEEEMED